MSTVNSSTQPNVYDEKGTVLYRAVPCSSCITADGNAGDAADSAATGVLDTSVVSGGSVLSRWKTARSGKNHSPATTVADLGLAMTLGGGSSVGAAAAAAASTTEGARVVQQSLTPECALAMLFPPEPLRVTTPRHAEKDAALSGTVTLRGPDTGWMKVAAIDHTGRLDSVHLQEHLERRCREEHARPSGIVCPVREGIYTDGLREAIRQTTVLCPERGLLLAELSAEMQQTTNTYDILFDSACQYAVRKAIERDLRSDLFVEKEQLESEVRRLENRVNELRAKHDGMVKRFEEQMQTEVNMHEEEVKYLKKANQQIVNEIKRLIALEKAGATAQASGQKPA